MQYQKDTTQYQKDSALSNDIKSLNYNTFSEFITKKTEKLVTALYMVTDCLDTEDAMKNKLRFLGVELLSNAHSFMLASVADKQSKIDRSNSQIYEILSLLDIASMMGFVSEMNSSILKKEFDILLGEYGKFQEKDNSNKNTIRRVFPQTKTILNEEFLSVPIPEYKEFLAQPSSFWGGDVSKGHIKDSLNNNVLYNNTNQDIKKDSKNSVQNIPKKEDRFDKMMSIIKIKKDVSIKDISIEFTNCSEKTIQRDLNDLVEKGLIKKTGSKRWSRYSLIL